MYIFSFIDVFNLKTNVFLMFFQYSTDFDDIMNCIISRLNLLKRVSCKPQRCCV